MSIASVNDPAHNLRAIVMELCLLEKHLLDDEQYCPDCIRKHFLTAEAYAREAVTLDNAGRFRGLDLVAPTFRELHVQWDEGASPRLVGQELRRIRRSLQKVVPNLAGRLEHSTGTAQVGQACKRAVRNVGNGGKIAALVAAGLALLAGGWAAASASAVDTNGGALL